MIKEQILIGDGRDRGIMQELKSQLKQYNLKYNYIPDDVKEFLIKIDLIENSYKKEYLF